MPSGRIRVDGVNPSVMYVPGDPGSGASHPKEIRFRTPAHGARPEFNGTPNRVMGGIWTGRANGPSPQAHPPDSDPSADGEVPEAVQSCGVYRE
ncbi:hypothetical protein GCM10023238_18660 [Streptomyces heliomycini]